MIDELLLRHLLGLTAAEALQLSQPNGVVHAGTGGRLTKLADEPPGRA